MGLISFDSKGFTAIALIIIFTWIAGILLGFRGGKRSVRPKSVGKILVQDTAKGVPAFKCEITPEFMKAICSSVKPRYVIFEVKEESDESNGM